MSIVVITIAAYIVADRVGPTAQPHAQVVASDTVDSVAGGCHHPEKRGRQRDVAPASVSAPSAADHRFGGGSPDAAVAALVARPHDPLLIHDRALLAAVDDAEAAVSRRQCCSALVARTRPVSSLPAFPGSPTIDADAGTLPADTTIFLPAHPTIQTAVNGPIAGTVPPACCKTVGERLPRVAWRV